MLLVKAILLLLIPLLTTAIGLFILIAPLTWFARLWSFVHHKKQPTANPEPSVQFQDPLASIRVPIGFRWQFYRFRKRVQHYFASPIRWVAYAALLLGLAILVFGYGFRKGNWIQLIEDFYANLAMELLSIFVTVIIIDQLNQRRSNQQEKQRIIAQMGSQSNDFALDAVRQARHNGWLTDGSLRSAYLIDANLAGADLKYADLTGSRLDRANLSGADLREANLCSANLLQANF